MIVKTQKHMSVGSVAPIWDLPLKYRPRGSSLICRFSPAGILTPATRAQGDRARRGRLGLSESEEESSPPLDVRNVPVDDEGREIAAS
jgi:hypothetical protein